MDEFDSPTYVVDFRDKKCNSNIKNAKPTEVIRVMVCDEQDMQGIATAADGVLDEDGIFHVTVTTDKGTQKHAWNFEFLLDAIRVHGTD